jgi:hypothetical protein
MLASSGSDFISQYWRARAGAFSVRLFSARLMAVGSACVGNTRCPRDAAAPGKKKGGGL